MRKLVSAALTAAVLGTSATAQENDGPTQEQIAQTQLLNTGLNALSAAEGYKRDVLEDKYFQRYRDQKTLNSTCGSLKSAMSEWARGGAVLTFGIEGARNFSSVASLSAKLNNAGDCVQQAADVYRANRNKIAEDYAASEVRIDPRVLQTLVVNQSQDFADIVESARTSVAESWVDARIAELDRRAQSIADYTQTLSYAMEHTVILPSDRGDGPANPTP